MGKWCSLQKLAGNNVAPLIQSEVDRRWNIGDMRVKQGAPG
jgi:hypothetical protein